jgi:hypothetical protein
VVLFRFFTTQRGRLILAGALYEAGAHLWLVMWFGSRSFAVTLNDDSPSYTGAGAWKW